MKHQQWHQREWERFARAEYRIVPWSGEWWATTPDVRYHFPHLVDGKVSFTSTDARGVADTKTLMRPGKYLLKFFGHVLSKDQIKDWANGVNFLNLEILFATTPEEITHVYTTGPSSCMSGKFKKLPMHPAGVYGAGDLAIAYIERNGKITARVLCWPEKKVYAYPEAIYGDQLFETLLQQHGYNPTHKDGRELRGARLLAVPMSVVFVSPDLPTRSRRLSMGKDGFLRIRKRAGRIGWHDDGVAHLLEDLDPQYEVVRHGK